MFGYDDALCDSVWQLSRLAMRRKEVRTHQSFPLFRSWICRLRCVVKTLVRCLGNGAFTYAPGDVSTEVNARFYYWSQPIKIKDRRPVV